MTNDVLRADSPMRKYAEESAAMNFDLPDSANAAKLNEIIWKSVRGVNSQMPAPRHTVLPQNDSATDPDGDE